MSYFFNFSSFTGFKVDALRMYLLIHVFLGLGEISGDSVVLMLRPGLLRLSSGDWIKCGVFSSFLEKA